MNKKNILWTMAGVFVIILGVLIVHSSISEGLYSLKIKNVLEEKGEIFFTKDFRVEGKVLKGSIKRGKGPFDIKFRIIDREGLSLQCEYHGIVPNPFKEERDVILIGKLKKRGVMAVQKIIVKCPSKYQEADKSLGEYEEYYQEKYKKEHKNRF